MSFVSRFVNVFRSSRVDEHLDEELHFHIEERTRALIEAGHSPDEAARRARRTLGNALVLRERSREVKLLPWLDALLRDVRYGARVLRREPVVTGAAVLSLALAMGACIAAFALIDALVLRPLPVREPERLVSLAYPDIQESADSATARMRTSFSFPALERMKRTADGLVSLFGLTYQAGPRDVALGGPGSATEKTNLQFVSGRVFADLGVTPALGRLLLPSDDNPARPSQVAVLSHALWVRRFGADSKVVGREVIYDRKHFTVVGVVQDGFTGFEPGVRTDLWVPLTTYSAEALTSPGQQWFLIVGQLAPGADMSAVQTRLQSAFRTMREERVKDAPPDTPKALIARFLRTPLFVLPARTGASDLRTTFERPLWILSAVVGLVLLIACSNVASLLTARGAAREREMALRISIGAGRGRLAQQLLIESVMMSAAACALGMMFAVVVTPAIVRMLSPADVPIYLDLRPGGHVIAFLAAIVVVTTVLFGLVPALRASRTAPMTALKIGGSRLASRTAVLRPLAVAQLSFGLAVVFVAGLLVSSFARLTTMDTGFTKSGITLLKISSDELRDRERASVASVHALVAPVLDRVRALPSVRAASLSSWGLFEGSATSSLVRLPGGMPDAREVYSLEVSPGFIETMGIQRVAGRDLTMQDLEQRVAAPDGPTVALVNAAFVARYFPGAEPLGRRFERLKGRTYQAHEIVGVVGNAKYRNLREPWRPTVYVPMAGLNDKTLEVRSDAPASAVTSAIRIEVGRIDPDLTISDTMDQAVLIEQTLIRERLLAVLSGFFAAVSLVLTAMGVYGMLTYSVVHRMPEIGIRVALGAGAAAVARAVLGEMLVVVLAGLGIGLATGLALSRFVRAVLYEASPYDPISLAVPIVILLAAAVVATVLPLRRALRVDPVVALRRD